MSADVVAVVPLKALHQVKQRLAPVLPLEARQELVGWMLGCVVRACHGAAAISRVVVVAGDEQGAALAAGLGAETLLHPVPGLRGALRHADAVLADAAATLVLAADLPLATEADVDAVCAAGPRGERVVVVPTIDRGTAALYRRPGAGIAPAHGPRSADLHLAAARAAGLPGVPLILPRLGFDVDLPEHVAVLRAWRRACARGGRA